MPHWSKTQLRARAIREVFEQEQEKLHPNFGSAGSTPTSRRVDMHYLQLRILERWTYERFFRLASLMKLTKYELASIACVPHSVVEKWLPHTPIPVAKNAGAYAIALLLTIIENHVVNQRGDGIPLDTINNPFPDLSRPGKAD